MSSGINKTNWNVISQSQARPFRFPIATSNGPAGELDAPGESLDPYYIPQSGPQRSVIAITASVRSNVYRFRRTTAGSQNWSVRRTFSPFQFSSVIIPRIFTEEQKISDPPTKENELISKIQCLMDVRIDRQIQ
jgi:hypothetical protein